MVLPLNLSKRFNRLPTSKRRYSWVMQSYSFILVQYRNGQRETFPPDYRFKSDVADARVLWILDAVGPVYRRLLGLVESISLKEVAA